MHQDCNHIKLLITGFIHNELDDADKAAVIQHLQECPVCAIFYNKLRNVEEKLRIALPPKQTQSIKDAFLQKIEQTKDEQQENPNIIRFDCSKCSKHFSAETKFIGKKMKCAKCGTVVIIPEKTTLAPKGSTPEKPSKQPISAMPQKLTIDTEPNDTPLANEIPTFVMSRSAQNYIPKAKKVANNKIAPVLPVAQIVAPSKLNKVRKPKTKGINKPLKTQRRNEYSEPKKNNNVLIATIASAFVLLFFITILFLSSNPQKAPVGAEEDTTPQIKPLIAPKIIADAGTEGLTPGEQERPVPPLRFDSIIPSEIGQYVDLNVKIEIEGGKPPFNWSIIGELPKGITFNNGVFSRWAEASGDFDFTIEVKDDSGQTATKQVSLKVYPEFRADYLFVPEMQMYQEIDYMVRAEGGKLPYYCDLRRKILPKGVDFIPGEFRLIGAPQEPGKFEIELVIIDALNQEIPWNYEWTINEPIPEPEPEDEIKNPPPDDPKEPIRPDELKPPDPRPDQPNPQRQPNPNELARMIQELRKKAHELYEAKKYKESIETYEEILKISEDDTVSLYNIACNYSLLNQRNKAIEYLERAIRSGFTDLNHIQNDKDLDNIRRMREFRNLTRDQDTVNKMALDAVKRQLAREFPPERGFLIKIDHDNKLVFATNLGKTPEQCNAVLELLSERLSNYATAQWRNLFKNKPEYYIKVVLPNVEFFEEYKRKKGFPPYAGGWYSNNTHFLIAGTMGYTLTHEFTHALHYADQGSRGVSMNIWFVEGLATVFEDSKLPERRNQEAEPIHNNRLNVAKQVVERDRDGSRGMYIPWRTYFTYNQRQFMSDANRANISYGIARYITYWLWETKKLKAFYENYISTFSKDRTGIAAMEMTFKKNLEQIEEDWKNWLVNQRLGTPEAYLGIRLANKRAAEGVVIYSVEKGTGAERAGLQSGDIIVSLNRMAIDHAVNLQQAIAECRVNQTITAVILRDGMPMEVRIRLGRRPENLR